MTYGLTVQNNDNYIQIDSDTPRLCAMCNGSYAASGSSAVTITFPKPIKTTEPPCIFIRNANQGSVLYNGMYILGSPGNWTGFQLSAGNVNWRPSGKWFAAVFASQSSALWGLRMWDAAGVIIYDSGLPPVLVTKATNAWSYQGAVQLDIGRAYYYLSAAVGALATDEYFMINPFSRGCWPPSKQRGTAQG